MKSAETNIQGIGFSKDTDFARFAREALLGKHGLGALPSDSDVMEPFERLYDALSGAAYQAQLSRAIADCLTDADPRVRRRALAFFQWHPQAEGGDRILDLVEGDRKFFRGTGPDPTHDLEHELLRALGARLSPFDKRAITLARRVALEAGKAHGVIAGLLDADPDWVRANAKEILSRNPLLAGTLSFDREQGPQWD